MAHVVHDVETYPITLRDERMGDIAEGIRMWCVQGDDYVDMIILKDRRDLAVRQGLKNLDKICQARHQLPDSLCD